ncbi:hypothetical protein GCM10023195_17830 [Actinoallomurus liliacearum]|uniref:Uncharacterized protein n=1 Tax=Actinoallomurus liliacearum TaxID=1080073 RepID=A0ABP8TGM8_9ACTN
MAGTRIGGSPRTITVPSALPVLSRAMRHQYAKGINRGASDYPLQTVFLAPSVPPAPVASQPNGEIGLKPVSLHVTTTPLTSNRRAQNGPIRPERFFCHHAGK